MNKPITHYRWLIEANVPGSEIGYRAIVAKDGTTICNPSPMGEGIAKLVASAPAMLQLILRGFECGIFADAPEYEQDVLTVMQMIQGDA